MELPVIATKLNIPGLSSHQIPRPDLHNLLEESINHKLILISAPAGFGKSSLVSAWSSEQKNLCWLSLDEGDNDPFSFFSHFFYAFSRLNPDFSNAALSALQERENVKFDPLIYSLINEISQADESLFLILDDYHVIEEDIIHKAIQLLLDRMPGQLHLVILTRSDPPFSLSRLRSSEEICEIRADDLKFDIAETETFLNGEWSLDIEAHDIRHLYERTEGWITGLQLSAYSLNKTETRSDFIQSLKGDDRYIADYLAEQVLQNLSEGMKKFLLQISILNRLCPSLADTLTGEGNSGDLLLQMEKDNLFLIPLDNHRKWYRLHYLFSDLLRQRLSGGDLDLAELHSRASGWYDQNGFPAEAIDHAIKSGRSEQIISLMEKYSNDFLFIRGETKNVLRWLKRIPEELIESSARLNLTYAWVLFYELALPQIQPYLDNVGKLLESDQNSDISAEYETILATIAILKGELGSAVDKYLFALQTLSPGNELLRGSILFGLGYGYISTGKLDEADGILEEAVTVNINNGNISISLKAYCFLAMCRILTGNAGGARQSVAKAFDLAERSGFSKAPVMSLAYSISAELDREENKLVEAAESASEAIEISSNHEDASRLFTAFVVMSAIKDIQHLRSGALSYLDKARKLISGKATRLSAFRENAVRHRLLLKTDGSVEREIAKPDENWLLYSGAIMIPGQVREYEHLTYVRYCMEKKEYGEALEILDSLLTRLDENSSNRSRSEINMLRMVIQWNLGNEEKSLLLLDELAQYSEDSGDLALFLEYPDAVGSLLQKDSLSDFKKHLAVILKTAGRKQSTPELIVPLSEREREVLPLLDTDMTNKEIADKLFVSVNTIKTHIKSINNKLDTSNRKEAVLKSRQLGLF